MVAKDDHTPRSFVALLTCSMYVLGHSGNLTYIAEYFTTFMKFIIRFFLHLMFVDRSDAHISITVKFIFENDYRKNQIFDHLIFVASNPQQLYKQKCLCL